MKLNDEKIGNTLATVNCSSKFQTTATNKKNHEKKFYLQTSIQKEHFAFHFFIKPFLS